MPNAAIVKPNANRRCSCHRRVAAAAAAAASVRSWAPRASHKSVGRAGLQLKLAGLCLRGARLLVDRKFGNALERFYGLHVQFLGQFLVLPSL